MFADFSRTAKIAIASGVATVVILATTLGVTLSPSSTRESKTASTLDYTSPSGGESLLSTCPCFDEDDLDNTVADIASGNVDFLFNSAGTCAEGDINGIKYSVNSKGSDAPPDLMGYGIALGDQNECHMQNAIIEITAEDADACSLILDAKCAEHQGILDAARPTCPCFDASSLVQVIVDVKAGTVVLEDSSCSGSTASNSIAYSVDMDYYSWGASQYGDCQYQDTMRIVDTQGEWDACKTIVDNACAEMA